MGFNKRYVSKEALILNYESGGINLVESYLTKPDALIFDSDTFEISKAENMEEIERILKSWTDDRKNREHNR